MRPAETLGELLDIRRANEEVLDRIDGPYGTALGRKGGVPAILVFVERKIHQEWLDKKEVVPPTLFTSRLSCPTDVFQVGGDLAAPYEPGRVTGSRLELRELLRGADPFLQPGSQLSFRSLTGGSSSGTLAAFARCRSTNKIGIVTNAHVGEFVGNPLTHPDEDSPVVARVTRLASEMPAKDCWDGRLTDADAFVVMDCAFAEFEDDELLQRARCEIPWIGDDGTIHRAPIGRSRAIDLDDDSLWPVGVRVFSVGRSQVDRYGSVRAVAYKCSHGRHVSTYTDLLIAGPSAGSDDWFSAPGDSGKLVVTDDSVATPVGLLWGGSPLRTDSTVEMIDHSFAVDLHRIEDRLGVDIGMVLPAKP